MARLWHAVSGAVMVLVLAQSGASAQATTGATLTQWGLAGTWSLDCGTPPSQQNYHLSFTVGVAGRAFYAPQFGAAPDPAEIESAKILPDRTIELIIKFSEPRRYVFASANDGRAIRTIVSQKVGGEYAVRDGKYVPQGSDTVWIKRCGT